MNLSSKVNQKFKVELESYYAIWAFLSLLKNLKYKGGPGVWWFWAQTLESGGLSSNPQLLLLPTSWLRKNYLSQTHFIHLQSRNNDISEETLNEAIYEVSLKLLLSLKLPQHLLSQFLSNFEWQSPSQLFPSLSHEFWLCILSAFIQSKSFFTFLICPY